MPNASDIPYLTSLFSDSEEVRKGITQDAASIIRDITEDLIVPTTLSPTLEEIDQNLREQNMPIGYEPYPNPNTRTDLTSSVQPVGTSVLPSSTFDMLPFIAPTETDEQRVQRLEAEVTILRRQMEYSVGAARRAHEEVLHDRPEESIVNPYSRTQPLTQERLQAYEALRAGGEANPEDQFIRHILDIPDDYGTTATRVTEPEHRSFDFKPGRILEMD